MLRLMYIVSIFRLEYGADPRHAEDRDSQTAMHLACKHNCLEIVKLLIQYKADINAVFCE
jgi:ankyrin repeat protein